MHSPFRLGIFTLCLAAISHGATIYTAPPDQTYGVNMRETLVAEDFTIASTTDFTNIRFWSIQSALADYDGSVYWAIYGNLTGGPILFGGTTAAISPTATALSTGFGYPEYVFNIPVAFQLAGGTYWVALHNGPLASTATNEMLWETTSLATGSQAMYFDATFGWTDAGSHLAFELEGTSSAAATPEPSSFVLLSSGLLAAAYARRRNQNNNQGVQS